MAEANTAAEVRACEVCGKDSTTADGIVGAYLCDDYTCLLAAYDRAAGTSTAEECNR